MSYNLKNRNLLSLDELSAHEVLFLLEMARELKRAKFAGTEQPQLRGKNIALLFERTCARTRCAFEIAAHDQGANVSFIGAGAIKLGEKESVRNTARVLGRLYDAIEYCGSEQNTVHELAQHAGVPVYNGLTHQLHPTQILADYMTMQEHCAKPLAQMRLAYLGDARRNIGDSLLQGAALMGLDFRIGAPRSLWPPQASIEASQARSKTSGAKLRFSESAEEAVQAADFIYTDAGFADGEPEAAWAERIALLEPYQVNAELLRASGNPAVRFLHCLPSPHERQGQAVHRRDGAVGLEVTDEVFESPASVVRDQAENRLHTIKALLVATLA